MLLHRLLKIDLRRLILALAVVGVMATLSNSFYATYEAQRELLISIPWMPTASTPPSWPT